MLLPHPRGTLNRSKANVHINAARTHVWSQSLWFQEEISKFSKNRSRGY